MDPLSLTANIIAVVGAAQSATRGLKRICALRYVPTQLPELLDEADNFQTVLASLSATFSDGKLRPQDAALDQHLRSLLEFSAQHIRQVNQIVEQCESHFPKGENLHSMKDFWEAWMKQRDVGKLMANLRVGRQEISTALTVLTASEVPAIRNTLRDIVLSQQDVRTSLLDLQQTSSSKIQELAAEVAATRPTFERLQDSIQQLAANENARSSPCSVPSSQALNISRRTSANQPCDSLCMCHCHKPTALQSPFWMQSLVGVIFISYFNTFRSYPCTEKTCRETEKRWFKLNFSFPHWFMRRILILQDQWTFNGHMLTVRTPRSVDENSSVLLLAQFGNIRGLQKLFSEGVASPFDVDIYGMSSLMLAVAGQHVDTCQFLLQQFADPRQVDTRSRSAISYVWDLLLRNPLDPTNQAIKSLFEPYIDMEDDLRVRNFTAIHQTVLKLTSIDLVMQLQVSTAQIDSRCSMGKTPLLWALDISNLEAARILIEFGASLDICNINGLGIFHYGAMSKTTEALELIVAASYSRNSGICSNHKNHTTIPYSAALLDLANCNHAGCSIKRLLDQRNNSGRSPLDFAIAFCRYDNVKFLLDHGASTEDTTCTSEATRPSLPLLIAVQYSSHEVLKLLLQTGARRDVIDADNRGILHNAAHCSDLKTIQILRDTNLCCIGIEDRDRYGQTPLEVFDHKRATQTPEDEATRLLSRDAFLQLLESIVPTESDHECAVNGFHSEPILVDSTSLDLDLSDLDVEEFWDAESTCPGGSTE